MGFKTSKNILFYCQHLLGLGHLTRSLAICSSLQNDHNVTFLQGGPDVKRTTPGIKHHLLSPLLMREHDSSLYDPKEEKSVDEIFEVRMQEIKDIASKDSFDAIIIELFPFGRRKFRHEITDMIEFVKARNPKCKVYCSLRDICVEKPNQQEFEQKVINIFNKYFDGVFVHSDERFIPLSLTFHSWDEIEKKIIYTGFVTEQPIELQSIERIPEIIVSMGGGIVGDEMICAVARVIDRFSNYKFRFFIGPNASQNLNERIERLVGTATNYEISGFQSNFEKILAQSSLSISLAGYNTTMNLLNTKTKALVYPYTANHEQMLRGRAFEKLGYMSVFTEKDLEIEKLSQLISSQLDHPYPSQKVNLDGSRETSQYLKGISP